MGNAGGTAIYTTYIAIEKSAGRFEEYSQLWEKRGIAGIHAVTMTNGIETTINLEKSKTQELYFISIVASEMPDFMEQLSILSEETAAPILVATENYTEKEHHEALNNGADFYGHFCETTEQNTDGVIAAINTVRRNKHKKARSNTLTYGGILISRSQRKTFVGDVCVDLTSQEFDILHFFMSNLGAALSYEQIYCNVWGGNYNDSFIDGIKSAIKRLRKKITDDESDDKIIENVRGFGYRMPL